MASDSLQKPNQNFWVDLAKNLVAGLAVSFVAISLGAAFGISCGRGAFAGILSAGIIALITGLFGGTRIQASGPTAPMTAVTAVVIAYAASAGLEKAFPGVDKIRFVNLVFALTAVLLIITAICRLGRFIQFVPKTVISGFMNGIAILIWVGTAKKLFGLAGKEAYDGSIATNVMVALVAFVIAFAVPILAMRLFPRFKSFLPGTLVAILVVTVVVQFAALNIEMVEPNPPQETAKTQAEQEKTNSDTEKTNVEQTKTENGDNSIAARFKRNLPTNWDPNLILLALPFAFQLTMLCYLDTLLTSLVMDKKMAERFGGDEVTKQNKELAAQGVATAAIAVVGGIPGAQATIRSVLILNEGATWRLASVAVGVFVLIEMLIFQDYISLIPAAVFSGILFKVGYDVFDWEPALNYFKRLFRRPVATGSIDVGHWDMFFIAGTAAVTLLIDLNIAVIAFTVLFYLARLKFKVPDLEAPATVEDQKD